MKDKNIVKIFWNDAVIYNYRRLFLIKKPNLVKKITMGDLTRETENYIVVKDPRTLTWSDADKTYIKLEEKSPTFFFIPKGMMKKVIKIKRQFINLKK